MSYLQHPVPELQDLHLEAFIVLPIESAALMHLRLVLEEASDFAISAEGFAFAVVQAETGAIVLSSRKVVNNCLASLLLVMTYPQLEHACVCGLDSNSEI